MIVCAIDPGLSGALAVLNDTSDLETIAMPTMGEGTKRIVDGGRIARFLADHDVEFAIVELASSMAPKVRGRVQGVASSFKFGTAFGQVIGVLQSCMVPHKFVTPAKWKKEMGLSRDKSLSRRRAIELLPQAAKQFERVKDEGRAEAALLALWWLQSDNHSGAAVFVKEGVA